MRFTLLSFLLFFCFSMHAQTPVMDCSSGVIDPNAENGFELMNQCAELNANVATISGAIEVNGTSNLSLNGDILLIDANMEIGEGATVIIDSNVSDMTGILLNKGTLIITGSLTSSNKLEFEGPGSVIVDGGSIRSTGGGIEISPGATLELLNESYVESSTGLVNEGEIVSDGTGNTIDGGVTGTGIVDPDLGDCSVSCTDGSSLPVVLLSFDGQEAGDDCVLSWVTAYELNNDYFEIYRSDDGQSFEKIGQLEGKGTTKRSVNYSFTDSDFSSNSYYRLRQVDFDGQYQDSEIILVSKSDRGESLSFVPNPYVPYDRFRLLVKEDVIMVGRVYSIRGEELFYSEGKKKQLEKQMNDFLKKLHAGVFLFELRSPSSLMKKKLVVRHP